MTWGKTSVLSEVDIADLYSDLQWEQASALSGVGFFIAG